MATKLCNYSQAEGIGIDVLCMFIEYKQDTIFMAC